MGGKSFEHHIAVEEVEIVYTNIAIKWIFAEIFSSVIFESTASPLQIYMPRLMHPSFSNFAFYIIIIIIIIIIKNQ